MIDARIIDARVSGASGGSGAGGSRSGGGASAAALVRVTCPLGEILARAPTAELAAGQRVSLIVRPEAAMLADTPSAGFNIVQGRISRRSFLGAYVDYLIDVGGIQLRVIAPSRTASQAEGEDALVVFRPADCFVLPVRDGGNA